WHARDGILFYPTLKEFLKAVAEFRATGAKLNATYVYDQATGLKLFGKTAFFVHKRDGDFATFLRKGEAEEFAAKVGGKVISFAEAVASSASCQSESKALSLVNAHAHIAPQATVEMAAVDESADIAVTAPATTAEAESSRSSRPDAGEERSEWMAGLTMSVARWAVRLSALWPDSLAGTTRAPRGSPYTFGSSKSLVRSRSAKR